MHPEYTHNPCELVRRQPKRNMGKGHKQAFHETNTNSPSTNEKLLNCIINQEREN